MFVAGTDLHMDDKLPKKEKPTESRASIFFLFFRLNELMHT